MLRLKGQIFNVILGLFLGGKWEGDSMFSQDLQNWNQSLSLSHTSLQDQITIKPGRSSTSVNHNSVTQMFSSQWPCTLPLLVIIKVSLLGLTARISLIIYFALRCQTPIGHILFVTQLAFSCSTNLISWLELRSLMPAHYPINHKESSSNSFACSPLQNIF